MALTPCPLSFISSRQQDNLGEERQMASCETVPKTKSRRKSTITQQPNLSMKRTQIHKRERTRTRRNLLKRQKASYGLRRHNIQLMTNRKKNRYVDPSKGNMDTKKQRKQRTKRNKHHDFREPIPMSRIIKHDAHHMEPGQSSCHVPCTYSTERMCLHLAH